MQRIFISYRRKDDAHAAGRLFEAMDVAFPGEVFMDVEGGIGFGKNFVSEIQRAIAAAEYVLVVIGANWLNSKDSRGRRRLDDKNDFVRIEVESAIKQKKTVVPVLINGVEMPSEGELPGDMKSLAVLNAVMIRTDRFKADASVLIKAIGGTAEVEGYGHPRTADEAMLALERKRWNEISAKPTAAALKGFVKQFPNGVFAGVARIRAEELAWEALPDMPKVKQLQAFLEEYPSGAHSDHAHALAMEHQTQEKEKLTGTTLIAHAILVPALGYVPLTRLAELVGWYVDEPDIMKTLLCLSIVTFIFHYRIQRQRLRKDRFVK